MNDLFYMELREKIREIRNCEQEEKPETTKMQREQILVSLEALLQQGRVARKEGLLALESEVELLTENLLYGELLKELVYLVTDGLSREQVEEIGLHRYFAEDMKAYEGFVYLLFLRGILAIVQEENLRYMEWMLRSMLPVELDRIYQQREQERQKRSEVVTETDLDKVEEVCSGTYTGEIVGVGAVLLQQLDYVVVNVSNQDLQRWLREMENSILKVALKGLGSKARKHVFQNMSKRLAVMIADEMILEGFMEECEIILASQEMLNVWQRLAQEGEVTDVDFRYT